MVDGKKRRSVIQARQNTQELLGGDEGFGNNAWQCVSDGCSTPSSTPWIACDGNCLHFNLNGGSNAQTGVQRTFDAAPLVNGGGSFYLSFDVQVVWTPTSSVTSIPTSPGSNSWLIQVLTNVAGTIITNYVGIQVIGRSPVTSSLESYTYEGLIPASFSGSSASISIGLNAGVPTGEGYYQLYVDNVSLKVPPSSSSPSSTSAVSSLTTTSSTQVATTQIVVNGTTSILTMSNMPTTVAPFVPQSSGASGETGVNVGDGSNGTDNTKLSKSTIIGIASAGVSLIVIIILLWWSLARRKKRRGQTSRSEKHVNPFLTPSEMTHRSSRSLIRDDIMMERRSNHPRGSPEPSPVMIDEAEQLRQWMASPITEILPPYQTEMGSAYVVRENTEEEDTTTDTYSPGLTVQNHDNVGGESTGDILRHQGRALRDLKR